MTGVSHQGQPTDVWIIPSVLSGCRHPLVNKSFCTVPHLDVCCWFKYNWCPVSFFDALVCHFGQHHTFSEEPAFAHAEHARRVLFESRASRFCATILVILHS